MTMKNEIILFETEDKSITLPVQITSDTVWLNRNQLAELFGRDIKTIGKHIGNALKEELEPSTVAKFATVQNEGGRNVTREIEYYNLDNHLLVLRPVEVFSRELIHEDVLLRDIHLFQCYHLSIFVLISAGYSHISVNLVFHNASSFSH